MRSVFPTVGIGVALLAAGLLLNRFYSDPGFLPPDDFLQYWAAGRLNATGGNPYDADRLLELQRSAGRPADKPAVMMWNPPWALTLAMPFGMMPPRTAQLLWLLAQVAIVVFCADRMWSYFGGESRFRPLAWGLSLGFYPVMYIVFAGQSSGWLLLGLAGLLLSADRRCAPLIPFAAIKPHLFVPIWIALACEAGRTRRGLAVLSAGLSAGLIAVLAPTLVNPDVWQQYFEAMSRPMDAAHSPLSGWKSPLIGYWVRAALSPDAFWMQAVPTLLVAVGTLTYWWKRRTDWNWHVEAPRLVLAGMMAAPYGAWPYDQIVLLVPVAAGLAHLSRVGLASQRIFGFAALAVLNGIALTIREGEHFVWLPPAIAVWYAWASTVKPSVPVEEQPEREQAAEAMA